MIPTSIYVRSTVRVSVLTTPCVLSVCIDDIFTFHLFITFYSNPTREVVL